MSTEAVFLSHRLPYPPNKGDKIRSFEILKHLAKRGPVHLACFIDEEEDLAYREIVEKIAGGRCLFIRLGRVDKAIGAVKAMVSSSPVSIASFASKRIHNWLATVLEQRPIRDIFVFSSAMAQYLVDQPVALKTVFDMVDVDSDKWAQYAEQSKGLRRSVYRREAVLLRGIECEAARSFGRTLLVSPFEARTFQCMTPESAAKVVAIENGVDMGVFTTQKSASPFHPAETPIVMTGRMDYRPNHMGAEWCIERVAPLVFDRLPTAHFYFVGAGAPASSRRLGKSNVTITGRVADVRPYIEHAAVVIAPLHMARGVQNKVLEAMAMGKCVVATYEATRALNVESGNQVWIENDPGRFADAIVRCVEGNMGDMGARARTYVEQNHNWNMIFQKLDAVLDELSPPALVKPPCSVATVPVLAEPQDSSKNASMRYAT